MKRTVTTLTLPAQALVTLAMFLLLATPSRDAYPLFIPSSLIYFDDVQQYVNLTCPPATSKCNITTCDPVLGCISTFKGCPNKDPHCYDTVCDDASGSCSNKQKSVFNTAVSPILFLVMYLFLIYEVIEQRSSLPCAIQHCR